MSEPFKVYALKISNLKNIVDVIEVNFQGKQFVEINGGNGAGKTAILDALFFAICGKKYFATDAWRLISKEKDKAMVLVTLGNKEKTIEIRRSITKKENAEGNIESGGSLSIRDTEGNPLDTDFLSGMLSVFTANPTAFSKMRPKEQVQIVKDLSGIDTAKFEEARVSLYEERKYVNREVKTIEGYLTKAGKVEKIDAVDIQKLLVQRREIEAYNREQDEINRSIKSTQAEIRQQEAKITQQENTIQDLRKQLEEAEVTLAGQQKKRNETIAQFDKMPIPKDQKSLDVIDKALDDAGETNRRAEDWKRYQEATKQHEAKKAKADDLDEKIGQIDQEKADAIKNSKLPFKNLVFDETVGLLIDDIPFSQHSRAEQLRISTRIGMEMSPDLRVLFIEEGSLLDEESYQVIRELAEKHGYQILVERTGEREGVDCIVMRAGKVISAFEERQTVAEQVRKAGDLL